MGHLAYLTPVGPFAGLSNSVRRTISKRFPGLPFAEVESAAERFSLDLQACGAERRLAEAREELNAFSLDLARFEAALHRLRKHRLDEAVSEATRMIGGEDEYRKVERSLQILMSAAKRTSRAVPVGCAELASRKLVASLATQMEAAGHSAGGAAGDALLGLVDLILDDLMVGGDARGAVSAWRKNQPADDNHDTVGTLIDLVVS